MPVLNSSCSCRENPSMNLPPSSRLSFYLRPWLRAIKDTASWPLLSDLGKKNKFERLRLLSGSFPSSLGLLLCRAAVVGSLSGPEFPSAIGQWQHHPEPGGALELQTNPQIFCKNDTHFLNGGKCQNGHAHHKLSSQRGNVSLIADLLSCCTDSSLLVKLQEKEETLCCLCCCQMVGPTDGGYGSTLL